MEFTENEKYWMDVISRGEKTIDDLVYKKDIWITEKFIEFMKKIIKYENLREDPELLVPCKRLIRIHKNIPIFDLEYYKYEYVIFNGLYVVTDVMFYPKSMLDKYFKPRKNQPREDAISLGIPRDSLYNIARDITIGNEVFYVAPMKNILTERYVNYKSSWSYPVFTKEGL